MSLTLAIVGTIVGGLAAALAFVVVRFNLKRLRIARIAAAAGEDELESIYRLLDDAVVSGTRISWPRPTNIGSAPQ